MSVQLIAVSVQAAVYVGTVVSVGTGGGWNYLSLSASST